MTQAIIPGCEANPDPNDVIDVTQKESNTMDNNEDTFDSLLVSAANAADSGKNLVKENERLMRELDDFVKRNHELYDEVVELRSANEELASDKQRLVDELEEEGAKPSGLTPRAVLQTIDRSRGVILLVSRHDWKDQWRIGNGLTSGPGLIAILEAAKFVDGKAVLDNSTVILIDVVEGPGSSNVCNCQVCVHVELN